MRRVILLSGARTDLDEAVRFYEAQKPGLGNAFLIKFHQVLPQIREYPFAAPVVHKTYRKVRLQKFLYDIIYSVETDKIVVIAVMHRRRNPDYWKARI